MATQSPTKNHTPDSEESRVSKIITDLGKHINREQNRRLDDAETRLDSTEEQLHQLTADLAELTQLVNGQDAGDPTINGIISTIVRELRAGPLQQVADLHSQAAAGQPIDPTQLEAIRTELTELVNDAVSRLTKLEKRVDGHDVRLDDVEQRLGLVVEKAVPEVGRLSTTVFGTTDNDGESNGDGLVDTVDEVTRQMAELNGTVGLDNMSGLRGQVGRIDTTVGSHHNALLGTDSQPGLIDQTREHRQTLYGLAATDDNPAGRPGLTHRVNALETQTHSLETLYAEQQAEIAHHQAQITALMNKGGGWFSSLVVGFGFAAMVFLICLGSNMPGWADTVLVISTFLVTTGAWMQFGKSFTRPTTLRNNEDPDNSEPHRLFDLSDDNPSQQGQNTQPPQQHTRHGQHRVH